MSRKRLFYSSDPWTLRNERNKRMEDTERMEDLENSLGCSRFSFPFSQQQHQQHQQHMFIQPSSLSCQSVENRLKQTQESMSGNSSAESGPIVLKPGPNSAPYAATNKKHFKMLIGKQVVRIWKNGHADNKKSLKGKSYEQVAKEFEYLSKLLKCKSSHEFNYIDLKYCMTINQFKDFLTETNTFLDLVTIQINAEDKTFTAIKNEKKAMVIEKSGHKRRGQLHNNIMFSRPENEEDGLYLVYNPSYEIEDAEGKAKAKEMMMYVLKRAPVIPDYVTVNIVLRACDTFEQRADIDPLEPTVQVEMTRVTAEELGVVQVRGTHMLVAYGPYTYNETPAIKARCYTPMSFSGVKDGDFLKMATIHSVYYTMSIEQMCPWEKLLDYQGMYNNARSLIISSPSDEFGDVSWDKKWYRDLLDNTHGPIDPTMAMMSSPRQHQLLDWRCLWPVPRQVVASDDLRTTMDEFDDNFLDLCEYTPT